MCLDNFLSYRLIYSSFLLPPFHQANSEMLKYSGGCGRPHCRRGSWGQREVSCMGVHLHCNALGREAGERIRGGHTGWLMKQIPLGSDSIGRFWLSLHGGSPPWGDTVFGPLVHSPQQSQAQSDLTEGWRQRQTRWLLRKVGSFGATKQHTLS